MIKNIAFRIVRSRIKKTLPLINPKLYRNMFNLSYRFFTFLKPSQIWLIILALLNKSNLKDLIKIPSLFILFTSFFEDSGTTTLNSTTLLGKLEANKFNSPENKFEVFFWIIIILAIIKRFTRTIFKLLWLPFKIAMYYYTLKYFGFDFSYAYNILNNLSLGIIDWFYDKITNFIDLIYPNDKNN